MRAWQRRLSGNSEIVIGNEGRILCRPRDIVAVDHASGAVLGVEVVGVAEAGGWVDIRDGYGG